MSSSNSCLKIILITNSLQSRSSSPVGSHIQCDGQCLAWWYPCYGRVQGQLPHRDAHPLGTQVSKPKDPLPICHHDAPHILLRPVLQHLVHVARVVDRDEQALQRMTMKAMTMTSMSTKVMVPLV